MMNEEDQAREIIRLTAELENVQSQNEKAAQYGLQVLDDKMRLQQDKEDLERQVEDLQAELENAKHEFDLSTKALQSTQSKTKKAFSEGEIRETDLDKQRRDAEEKLAVLTKEKEIEVYQLQNIVKSSNSEIERLSALNNELVLANQTLDKQRLMMKRDLKEMKISEAHMDAAYSELEEENCSLQKHVSNLKETQVEFEGCKHENRRLSEELEYVSRELMETVRLKELLERQVEDAHETIQKEREIKFGLKRELAQYDNIDLTGITLHNQFLDENVNESKEDQNEEEIEHPLIRHITSDLIHNGKNNENGNDLYSELNFSEISKLKQQLCVAEKEKVLLINNLREQQVLMENKNRETTEKSEKRLTATVNQRNTEAQNSCDKVQAVSDRISQLYHRLCLSNGDVPKQVVLESAKDEARKNEDEQEMDNSVLADEDINDTSLHMLSSSHDPTHGVLTAMLKQMDCLETEVDNLVMARDTANLTWSENNVENQETQEQMRTLEEEVLRLKSLLSSKREQIATLRTVLKANKHTAEVAISNLKEKYQHEKACISGTMLKLRGELKALKEDAITFARLRMVFAARSDEYVAQLDAMQRQLQSAEDEKRTLNTLLRKTITQKLGITQRLEDLQFEIEQQKRHGNSSSPCKQQQQENSAKKKASKLLGTKFRS